MTEDVVDETDAVVRAIRAVNIGLPASMVEIATETAVERQNELGGNPD
ncbi:hypothetical protein [Amycolatopsis pithecellobii]|uniref:Uncharacterized protein n=1 Tax=Amycolatopsis pithecellobii TaxID=664692 RepID=A0A6N7Z3J0_9PSEU|nr:hypothetical protein [Amycolatopsis pithecellobii]MTD56503.1 hypothetical protein [Amycolatopsis pithecellobii]